ncbi:MAG: hypothetical protein ABSC25_07995 [Roseiarcus sp.]|jgi:hypothetical protein
MRPSALPEVVCRPIDDDDIDAVIACLQRGFPERPRRYWERALERMARRPAIDDYPRYGQALVVEGNVVGVLLQIFSRRDAANGGAVRCNLSSWCVDGEHRGFSAMLHLNAVKRKEVTYVNISPAAHTWKTIEAFGFRRFAEGQMVLAPILSPPQRNVRVVAFGADRPETALLSADERRILVDHAALGCRALVCVEDGLAYPFVFQPRAIVRNLIPCPHLIYCRDMSEFVRFANAIGRYLLFRSGPLCVVDAMGRVPGLVGWFVPGRLSPKYFKGPVPPGLGDLAYTELVILGP